MSEGLNYTFLIDTFFVALSGVPITLTRYNCSFAYCTTLRFSISVD